MSRGVSDIRSQLVLDEGVRLQPYEDHLGYLTIGVGRLIDVRRGGGISREEAMMMLDSDIAHRVREMAAKLPFFDRLDEARKGVLINMSFQLGVSGLMNFVKTLRFVGAGLYEDAAHEMLRSTWARQTPERARRLSTQMRTGEWQ